MQLSPNQYVIKIKGVRSGQWGTDDPLFPGHGCGSGNGEDIRSSYEGTGLRPALWITADQREKAEMSGYTVVDCPSVLATHLTEIIRNYAFELVGRQEIKPCWTT